MPLRRTEADPAREQAVTDARTSLREALAVLAGEASLAQKGLRSPRAAPDLTNVYAATRAVERAEEAVDLAVYDRETAAGEDG